jgi:uncharacterized protein YbaP (TraB family)
MRTREGLQRSPPLFLGALLGWVLLVPFLAEAGPFLWRAQKEGGVPIYLFGALHYSKPSSYPLPTQVEQTYSESTALAVEVDITRGAAEDVANVLGQYRGDGHLSRDVPSELLEQVNELSKRYGWERASISRTRPWVLGGLIAAADLESRGFSRQWGIDRYFLRRAKEDGKPILELESLREQYDIFNRLPMDAQVFFLRDSVESVLSGENAETMLRMTQAWLQGDAEAVRALTEKSLAQAPDPEAIGAALYVRRNERMLQRLGRSVDAGERLFVVVGLAHLAGPNSLLELLAQDGFAVQQVVGATTEEVQ